MLTSSDFNTRVPTPAELDAAVKRAHRLRSEVFLFTIAGLGKAFADLAATSVRLTRHMRHRAEPARPAPCG